MIVHFNVNHYCSFADNTFMSLMSKLGKQSRSA